MGCGVWCARLAALVLCVPQAIAMCPSACSGHGVCTPSNTCLCFEGYTGFDCFGRTCPVAPPWTDFATGDDNVRSTPRECANRGRCQRDSGRCSCDDGFAGQACERLVAACNGNCNGHGRCLSLRDIGPMKNDATLVSTAIYETPWDADRVFGCVCDKGYTGPGCTKRLCPYGDDPITTGQVDEIQALSCTCDGCSGNFTLSFRGETTRALYPAVETRLTLKQALEELLAIRAVSVSVSSGATDASPICSTAGISALITFTLEHGDVPSLVVDASSVSGGTSTITIQSDGTTPTYGGGTTQRGTKEWEPCSARGICDSFTGICTCNSGFGPSDGLGNSGDIADCGYQSVAVTNCPVNYGSACSGHGRCSGNPLYQCSCDNGYYGHDCSRRRCARGRAWWEEPLTDNVAHMSLVECANGGACDEIGICRCFTGFEGVACDRLSCPTSGDGVCSGRGQCKSLKDLAALTPTASFGTAGYVYGKDPNAVATWEAATVQGCYCDKVHWKRGQSVRYTGHDCGKVPCPRGDDPWTSDQVDDIQSVQCTATGGSFKLTFRGETTAPIPASASTATMQSALESLRTISSVSVVFSAGVTSACVAGGNAMIITFFSPTGNLPVLTVDMTKLTFVGGTVALAAAKTQPGTKEDIVCNNRGRCDDDSGMCICALHHASSDAKGGFGVMNDCGVVDKFMTHGEL